MSRVRARGASGSAGLFPCVRCGAPLRRVANRGHLEIRCPRCRFLIFDYPRACAGTVVMKGDRVLMLRRAHLPKRGWLDIPGGFMEANETIENAARRELREETGLELGALRQLGIYWDRYYIRGFGYFPTLNFYFIGRWRSRTPRAADDAASAEWIPLVKLGTPGQRLAWKHMRDVFRDVRALRRRSAPRLTS